jgi:ferredoxin-NADP reductase
MFFNESLTYLPGQHGLFTFKIEGKEVERVYSFHTSPVVDESPGITIKRVPSGVVSNFINNSTITDLELISIQGRFTLTSDEAHRSHIVMFGAGSGITPLLSILRSLLHTEPTTTISLLYSSRSFSSMLFREELMSLAKTFNNRLGLYFVVTGEDPVPSGYPIFLKERLSRIVLRKFLKNLSTDDSRKIFYLMCGPQQFMTLIEQTLHASGVQAAHIRKEHFFSEMFEEATLAQPRNVVFVSDEKELSFLAGEPSLLESALIHGVKVAYSCRQGQCGVCQATLVQGEVSMKRNYALTAEEVRQGTILLCQSVPLSDNVRIQVQNTSQLPIDDRAIL